MRNLDWLYDNDETFRGIANQAAADYIGSTNINFAGYWLMEQHKYEHHDSDYEDLRGQHLDGPCVVPDREKQVDRITDMVNAKIDERDMGKLVSFARRLESAAESSDDVTLFGVDYVSDSKFATLKEHCAGQAEQLRRLTDECAELRKVAERYKADSVAAQADADAWRAKCGALLDAAHEMIRIGGDV